MGLFEEEVDYVDYSLLKKKGLIKAQQDNLNSIKTDGGFIDFTSIKNETQSSPANATSTETPTNNNFAFLADMAGVGSSSSTNNNNQTTQLEVDNNNLEFKDVNSLKVKIDDMEYKLERFIERINKLEEQLSKIGQN